MALSDELTWRGFVNQTTLPDLTILDKQPVSFYFGVDPSSDSMTIGNLAAAMMVRHFIEAGHKAYLLVGEATGMIGDPDGKKQERDLKSREEISNNTAAISRQYEQIFAGQSFEVVNNFDWFKTINYIDFLRDIGKHVPLSSMLGRDFVQSRLGEDGTGISYAEFSYSLIQGYDFLHLYRKHGVTLQLCGADQWGNSITGVDLIRRIEAGEAHVYSTPLVINRSTGRKFGKSEEGAIWLDAAKTSVYAFYQFWLNVDDEGVADYAKIYTLLGRDDIAEMERSVAENPRERYAQRRLAMEVTSLVHGPERADRAAKVTSVLFGQNEFASLTADEIDDLSREIPVVELGSTVVGALVQSAVVASNSEALRLIAGRSITLNGQKIDVDQVIDAPTLIKKGKNSFILVR
ncbi:tyrosine--tRNA ligase [Candidatus Saccharibacteria bacterium 32-49-12]|nr:MAG: tyrosine--tRNA ligase [Candidatus Saccharibacteria bacterium 32-49-12]